MCVTTFSANATVYDPYSDWRYLHKLCSQSTNIPHLRTLLSSPSPLYTQASRTDNLNTALTVIFMLASHHTSELLSCWQQVHARSRLINVITSDINHGLSATYTQLYQERIPTFMGECWRIPVWILFVITISIYSYCITIIPDTRFGYSFTIRWLLVILPLHFTISTTVLCPITLSCYSYQLRVSILYIFVLLLFIYYLVAYTYNRLATNISCYSYQLRPTLTTWLANGEVAYGKCQTNCTAESWLKNKARQCRCIRIWWIWAVTGDVW